MTQGIVAYECLLFTFDCFEDEYDRMEEQLDEQLRLEDVDVAALNLLERADTDTIEEEMKSIEDAQETRERIRIWLPERIEKQADWSRGWGEKLGEAVVSLYASVYADRLDRVACKRDILQYVRDGQELSHSVAQELVKQESDILDQSNEDSYRIETVEDYHQIAGRLDNWHTDRYPALRSLYHSVSSIGKDAIVNLVCEAHKINDTDYASRRINEFEDEYEEIEFGEVAENEGKEKESLQDRVDEAGLPVAIHDYVRDSNSLCRSERQVMEVFIDRTNVDSDELFDCLREHDGEYWDMKDGKIDTTTFDVES